MSGRFSFEQEEDDSSYQPHTQQAQQASQYHSARGPGGYQVSLGAAYIPPPREPSPSFASELHYDSQPEHPSDRDYAHSMDDSHPPPLPPPHRDPHAVTLPIPPLYAHHRAQSSSSSISPPRAALGLAGAAAAALDTSYHGAGGAFHSRDRSDPFNDTHESDSLNHAYHDYSTSAQDPFASNRTSRQDLSSAPGAAAAYGQGMRPPTVHQPASFDAYGHGWHESEASLGEIDPHDIADEDEEAVSNPKGRKTAAGAGGFLGGMASRDVSGRYGQVPGGDVEKSTWLKKQTSGKKRWKWIVGSLVGATILLAIIGGVVGGVIISKKGTSSPSSSDPDAGQDLDINSPDIKALMNNQNLHRIFPGIDYTPYNAAQYPECLTNPPSQDNVTKDVAVLSQLTPQIRLYGTDCNQTQMVLHAIDKLNMNDTMKVWLGVYLDANQTTNDRQLAQMWSILDEWGDDPFAGLIIGNEVLFSQYMSTDDLVNYLNNVRKNVTANHWNLTVSTSDLGSNWNNSALVEASDIVMANVHPFFAGVGIDLAASWTYTYWQTNDVAQAGSAKESYIAETGWPSAGGNLCTNGDGADVNCTSPTAGAVASVQNQNTFMNNWACQALANGTKYFMFEAFDESWKAIFNTPLDGVETYWGILDDTRTDVKPGLQIPDCGGKTA